MTLSVLATSFASVDVDADASDATASSIVDRSSSTFTVFWVPTPIPAWTAEKPLRNSLSLVCTNSIAACVGRAATSAVSITGTPRTREELVVVG